MDLLSYGLIIGSIVVLGESILYIKNNIFSVRRTWNKLGLYNYKIKNIKKYCNGIEFEVKIPIGSSFSEIQNLSGKIEKAYGCKCNISDIDYSNYVLINLKTK